MKTANAFALLAFGLGTLACRAEDIEPLDADFLEYLAALEDEDGDWTEVADEPPAVDCKAQSDASRCKPDETEDAAKTAVEKR